MINDQNNLVIDLKDINIGKTKPIIFQQYYLFYEYIDLEC